MSRKMTVTVYVTVKILFKDLGKTLQNDAKLQQVFESDAF